MASQMCILEGTAQLTTGDDFGSDYDGETVGMAGLFLFFTFILVLG